MEENSERQNSSAEFSIDHRTKDGIVEGHESPSKSSVQAKILDYYKPSSSKPSPAKMLQKFPVKPKINSLTRSMLEDVCSDFENIDIILGKPQSINVESSSSYSDPLCSTTADDTNRLHTNVTESHVASNVTETETLDPVLSHSLDSTDKLISESSNSVFLNSSSPTEDQNFQSKHMDSSIAGLSKVSTPLSSEILSSSSFNISDSPTSELCITDLQRLESLNFEIVSEHAIVSEEIDSTHSQELHAQKDVAFKVEVPAMQNGHVKKRPKKQYTKPAEPRQMKARRITAKMKHIWTEELSCSGHITCPITGCHQNYVTVANFQTHYKWCTGRKNLQYCPYCESLIFTGHEAVLRHMEVEHPEKLEEYKAKNLVEDVSQEQFSPVISDVPEIGQTVNIESKPTASKTPRKYNKLNNIKKNVSSKESFAHKSKAAKQGLKCIEETMSQNLKEFQKCVRFNDIVQKINSIKEESACEKVKKERYNCNELPKATRKYTRQADIPITDVEYFSDGDVDSPGVTDDSADEKPPRRIGTKSRVMLNTRGYERFSQYLKLTRDWASERRTYSRSRSMGHDYNSSQSDTSFPEDVQDVFQLSETIYDTESPLHVVEALHTSKLANSVIDSSIKKVPEQALSQPFIGEAKLQKKLNDFVLPVDNARRGHNALLQHFKSEDSPRGNMPLNIQPIPDELNYGHMVFSKPNKVSVRERNTCYGNAGNRNVSHLDPGYKNERDIEDFDFWEEHELIKQEREPMKTIDFDQLIKSQPTVSQLPRNYTQPKTLLSHLQKSVLRLKKRYSVLNSRLKKNKLKENPDKCSEENGVKFPKSLPLKERTEIFTKKRRYVKGVLQVNGTTHGEVSRRESCIEGHPPLSEPKLSTNILASLTSSRTASSVKRVESQLQSSEFVPTLENLCLNIIEKILQQTESSAQSAVCKLLPSAIKFLNRDNVNENSGSPVTENDVCCDNSSVPKLLENVIEKVCSIDSGNGVNDTGTHHNSAILPLKQNDDTVHDVDVRADKGTSTAVVSNSERDMFSKATLELSKTRASDKLSSLEIAAHLLKSNSQKFVSHPEVTTSVEVNRGRKRKVSQEEVATVKGAEETKVGPGESAAPVAVAEPTVMKRKRGRPRKNPEARSAENIPESPLNNSLRNNIRNDVLSKSPDGMRKGKRGRPRKYPVTLVKQESEVEQTKKDVLLTNGVGDSYDKTVIERNEKCERGIISDLTLTEKGVITRETTQNREESSLNTHTENFQSVPSFSQTVVDTKTPVSVNDIPVKRKRGRPPKYPRVLDTQVSHLTDQSTPAATQKPNCLNSHEILQRVKSPGISPIKSKNAQEIFSDVTAVLETSLNKNTVEHLQASVSLLNNSRNQKIHLSTSTEQMQSKSNSSFEDPSMDNDESQSLDTAGIRKSTRLRKIKVDPDAVITFPKKNLKPSVCTDKSDVTERKQSDTDKDEKIYQSPDNIHMYTESNSSQFSNKKYDLSGLSDSLSKSILKDDISIKSTTPASSDLSISRRGLRKGRPRKCADYVDLNCGIESPKNEQTGNALVMSNSNISSRETLNSSELIGVMEDLQTSEDQHGIIAPIPSVDEHLNDDSSATSKREDKNSEEVKQVSPSVLAVPKTTKNLLKKRTFFGKTKFVPNFSKGRHVKIEYSPVKKAKPVKEMEKNDEVSVAKEEENTESSSKAQEEVAESGTLAQQPPLIQINEVMVLNNLPGTSSGAGASRRRARSAAMKALRTLRNVARSEERLRAQGMNSRTVNQAVEEDADFVLSDGYEISSDEPEDSSFGTDECELLKKDVSVHTTEKQLLKFKDFYIAPLTPASKPVATKQMGANWAKAIEIHGRVTCQAEGCGKSYTTKGGMVYHYESGCLRAKRRYLCKLCEKQVKYPTLMLKHMKQNHMGVLNFQENKSKGIRDEAKVKKLFRFKHDYTSTVPLDVLPEFGKSELFLEFRPKRSMWRLLSERELEQCHPPLNASVKIKVSMSPRVESPCFSLPCFESNIVTAKSSRITFFAGGPIWRASWCPTPHDVKATQYVALASGGSIEQPQNFSPSEDGRKGLIQIWDVGTLDTKVIETKPVLKLAIRHKYTSVSNMVWCPTGCWDNPSEISSQSDSLPGLGLLAVTCGPHVQIFSIPHPQSLGDCSSANLPFYEAQPCAVLEPFEGTSGPCLATSNGNCLSLCWQRTDNCERILAGYTNGMVAVWKLAQVSEMLVRNEKFGPIFFPILTFQAHRVPVTSVAFAPLSGGTFCATGAFDSCTNVWDLTNPCMPIYELKRGKATSVQWPRIWLGYFICQDDGFSAKYCTTYYADLSSTAKYVHGRSISMHTACGWSSSVSDWLNVESTGDAAGEVTANVLNKLGSDYKSKSVARYPVFRTEVKLLTEMEGTKQSLYSEKADGVTDGSNCTITKENLDCDNSVDTVVSDLVQSICTFHSDEVNQNGGHAELLHEEPLSEMSELCSSSAVSTNYTNETVCRTSRKRKREGYTQNVEFVVPKTNIDDTAVTYPNPCAICKNSSDVDNLKCSCSVQNENNFSIVVDTMDYLLDATAGLGNETVATVNFKDVWSPNLFSQSSVPDNTVPLCPESTALYQCYTEHSRRNLGTSTQSKHSASKDSQSHIQESVSGPLQKENVQSNDTYAGLTKRCGIVFKDFDLANLKSIPKEELLRTRTGNLKDLCYGDYPLSSVNSVSWNPNGCPWLLTAGQCGIARLICASSFKCAGMR